MHGTQTARKLPEGWMAVEYKFPKEFIGMRVYSHPDTWNMDYKKGWPPKKNDLKPAYIRNINYVGIHCAKLGDAIGEARKNIIAFPFLDIEFIQAMLENVMFRPKGWTGMTVHCPGTRLIAQSGRVHVPYMQFASDEVLKIGATPIMEERNESWYFAYLLL